MEPGAVQRLQGQGIRRVKLQVVLSILPWLVISLFADPERILLIVGLGTPWEPFRVIIFPFWGS
jgi:hypothetical protein